MQRKLCCCRQAGAATQCTVFIQIIHRATFSLTDASKETCADPLLTEPNSQYIADKTSDEKLLILQSLSILFRGCGGDNFLSQSSHRLFYLYNNQIYFKKKKSGFGLQDVVIGCLGGSQLLTSGVLKAILQHSDKQPNEAFCSVSKVMTVK